VTLHPERLRAALLWLVGAFTVLTAGSRVADEWAPGSVTANALRFFDATLEQTIPTAFSGLLLLVCAALVAVIASSAVRWRGRWWLLATATAFFALDEMVAFHEASAPPLRRLLDADGALYYAWVIPGALLVAALIPAFRPLVAELGRRRRRLFVAAAVTFFGSAIGFELVEGWLNRDRGRVDPALIPVVTAEETLEMVGAVLFLYVLMDVLAPGQLTLRMDRGGRPAAPARADQSHDGQRRRRAAALRYR
jgi:hypothetical protein